MIEDFDADGDADIAVAGKSGTYLLTNQGANSAAIRSLSPAKQDSGSE